MYSCTRAYTTKQITKQIRVRRCVPCSEVESRIIGSSKIGVWSRGCAGGTGELLDNPTVRREVRRGVDRLANDPRVRRKVGEWVSQAARRLRRR